MELLNTLMRTHLKATLLRELRLAVIHAFTKPLRSLFTIVNIIY